MYEAYYSLEDPPFVLTPDPRFLLRSKGHHEILGTLLYGITSQKGLMALVGDVGTGKTTLCRALLRDLPDNVQSALVLDQRIGIRSYLQPLPRKETYRYVEHRLRVAGLPGAVPFTRGALAKIYKYSRGIPRVINLVCDRALMAGFSNRMREITPSLVTSAVRNLEGGRQGRNRYVRMWSPAGGTRRTALLVGAVGALVLAGAAAAYWGAALHVGGLRAGVHAKLPQVAAVSSSALSPAAPTLVPAPS